MGSWNRNTHSNWTHCVTKVVTATAVAANANPTSSAAGSASTAHQDPSRPIAPMIAMNTTAYVPPRTIDEATSASAMSIGPIGVARIAWNTLAWRNFMWKLNEPSIIAPFIADAASMAGATNAWYEIGRPSGPGNGPTRRDIPTLSDTR